MSHGVPPTMEPQSGNAAPEDDRESATPSKQDPTGPDALNEALRRLAEVREYVVYLATVEIDRLKLKFRRLLIWAAVAIAGLVVLLATLVAAIALLLWGLADLIGDAFGGRTWIGALMIGGGVLLVGGAAAYGGIWAWKRSAYHAIRRRYEARKQRQRAQFGHSVDSRDDHPV